MADEPSKRSIWTNPWVVVPIYLLGLAYGLTALSFSSQRAEEADACRRLGGQLEERGCMLPTPGPPG
jgi:hypothetical protein